MRVAVGIPTFEEAGNISTITRLIDEAISQQDSGHDYVIVNVDNNSVDRTAELFESTPTRAPKISLSSRPGTAGKGENLRGLFSYATAENFDVTLSLDADLRAVPPEWLTELTRAVADPGPVLAIPLYGRPVNDGNLTDHVAVPILAAATGHAVRQPIGGDFAFNRQFMDLMLDQGWPAVTRQFGVDLHLVGTSLRNGGYRQVPLGVGKHHGWRRTRADQVDAEFRGKFEDVVTTLMTLVAAWPQAVRVPPPAFPVAPPYDTGLARTHNPAVMKSVARTALDNVRNSAALAAIGGPYRTLPVLDDDRWSGILAAVLACWPTAERASLLDAFRALLYCRIATIQDSVGRPDAVHPDVRVGRVTTGLRRHIDTAQITR